MVLKRICVCFGLILLITSCNEKGVIQSKSPEKIGSDQDEYSLSDISEKYIGTYLPLDYMNTLQSTKSHYYAILKKNITYHNVLAIEKNKIYSNLLFHDQYAIPKIEFKKYKFFETNGIIEVIDDKRNRYQKISSSVNYYTEISKYVISTIFNGLPLNENKNLVIQEDSIILNGNLCSVHLDAYNIPQDSNVMFRMKSDSGDIPIAVIIKSGSITFFELESDEELRLKISKEIISFPFNK